jgi:hypothetical protein
MRLPFPTAALGLLLATSPALAQDKPKPNTLTPKEIADGYVLLFDGETTFGWTIEGEAVVKAGWLVLGGTKATTATSTAAFPGGQLFCRHEFAENLPEAKTPRITLTKDNVDEPFSFGHAPKDRVGYPIGSGRVQVRFTVPAGTTLKVRDVTMHPATRETLFSGKSLDGWKVNMADPKRAASKFEVTKDGELSVKNGPGDLVTEKEFDNFVLQFECKTLGKNLNSGIFFRCIPGQYQNGYEAQIQNAFKDNDRTKPVDFGTGAIYRRVPARKVVSDDNEWFTMTVVADGKHIATWVNGYQTVDWTDDRKENDNPRQGYRAAKGPLSIQGHDPTTDLLFRNIRIAELPAK